MEAEKIFKLIDAGFTKAEIMQLVESNTYGGQKPEPDPEPEKPDPDPEKPDPEPEKPDPEPEKPDPFKNLEKFGSSLDNFLEQMNATLKKIQAANAGSDEQPDIHQESPEDIFASIVIPKSKKG